MKINLINIKHLNNKLTQNFNMMMKKKFIFIKCIINSLNIKSLMAEERAMYPPPKISVNSLPLRSYLDAKVTPLLFEALKILAKERYFY